MRKIVEYALLVVVVCAIALVLWFFSSQDSERSNVLSQALARFILSCLDMEMDQEQVRVMNLVVRKTAHFFLFFCLGAGVSGTLRQVVQSWKKISFITMLIGVMLATLDELHQYFTLGRYSSIRDVCLDCFGVFCGFLICFTGSAIVHQKKVNVK